MQIAVLGLGSMGTALAGRLLDQGHHVIVWNRSPGKATPLTARGAILAGSPLEAAQAAGCVVTFLSDDAAVKQVALGQRGVIAALPDTATLVDMSTVSPETSRELAAAAPGRVIDAPVLGGPAQLAQGAATIVIGGPEERVRALEPLWDQISSNHHHVGPNGSGTTVKAISNLMLISGLAALGEAVVTAQMSGIPNDTLRAVLAHSPVVSPSSRVRLDDIIDGDHRGWFPTALARKDMRIVQDLAARHHVSLPNARSVEGMLTAVIEAGRAEQDLGAIVEAVRSPKPEERRG